MVVIAGFSLVIYYWAIATRLPSERTHELINAQTIPGTEAAEA
jgi:hypothetical protein